MRRGGSCERPRLRSVRGCCSTCAHALSHGRLPLPQSRLDAAGVTRAELLAGEGGPSVTGLLADLRDEARRSLVASSATCGEFAAGSACGLPSFGLGRVLSAGPGAAGSRSAARGSRDCAAHTRGEDCRWRIGSVASDAIGSGGADEKAARAAARGKKPMRIDAGRSLCLAARSDGACMRARPRPSRASTGTSRTPSASSSTRPIRTCTARPGRACRTPSAAIPCRRRSGCWASAIPTAGAAITFAKTCWDPGRNRYACRDRADYLNPKSHTDPGAAGGARRRANGRLRLADLAARARPAGRQGR